MVDIARVSRVESSILARIGSRRAEIGKAVFARVKGVSGGADRSDPEYEAGLQAAVAAGIDHAIDELTRQSGDPLPIPASLLTQARLAAYHGVGLDTVLRRCVAGYALLGEVVLEEIGRSGGVTDATLRKLVGAQARLLDRVIHSVSEQYIREQQNRHRSPEQRRVELVRRLLAGEASQAPELQYVFSGFHLGVVASGPRADETVRAAAADLGRRALAIPQVAGTVWAWLGSRSKLDPGEFVDSASRQCHPGLKLAVGEPAEGLVGWRLTHRQACAAQNVARQNGGRFIRYGQVALAASVLTDDLLGESLRALYLAPLATERDGGETLRETLRAYFAARRNASSAAAALGVTRQTVRNRLETVEDRIGPAFDGKGAEMEAAVLLQDVTTANEGRAS